MSVKQETLNIESLHLLGFLSGILTGDSFKIPEKIRKGSH